MNWKHNVCSKSWKHVDLRKIAILNRNLSILYNFLIFESKGYSVICLIRQNNDSNSLFFFIFVQFETIICLGYWFHLERTCPVPGYVGLWKSRTNPWCNFLQVGSRLVTIYRCQHLRILQSNPWWLCFEISGNLLQTDKMIKVVVVLLILVVCCNSQCNFTFPQSYYISEDNVCLNLWRYAHHLCIFYIKNIM